MHMYIARHGAKDLQVSCVYVLEIPVDVIDTKQDKTYV